jgi:adenine C2-methylase RlmN of 23S rRNA A2503 and tRNA A37
MAMAALLVCAPRSAWTLSAGSRIAPFSKHHYPMTAGSSILDLHAAELWCTERGLTERHLANVYRHLLRRGGEFEPAALHAGAELPRASAEAMCDHFGGVLTSRVVERVPSDGGLKLVVELASGHRVETVLILHEHQSSGKSRCTVCVSSQVGCARGCTFCETGTMGLRADLTASEILEQVWHARKEVCNGYEVRNVVFMGMGEPLDNYDALLSALRGLTHQCLFDLSAKHLTVSTVGADPARIRQLAIDAPRVRLALSLHSAMDPLRAQLIPSATSLPELTDALDDHARTTRCGLMIEFLLIDGLNDADADADALAGFCAARTQASAHVASAPYVNLIPFNPTAAGSRHGYATPSDEAVERFHTRLREVHGVHALIRWKSAVGRDANGACGQLATRKERALRG